MRKMLMFIAAVVVIAAVAMQFGTPSKSPTFESAAAAVPPSVVMTKFAGTRDGIVFLADFTFENKGAADIKDVEVKCTHFGPSGTAIDTNTSTIYEIVKAKSTKSIRRFNMGIIHPQATGSSCAIVRYAGG